MAVYLPLYAFPISKLGIYLILLYIHIPYCKDRTYHSHAIIFQNGPFVPGDSLQVINNSNSWQLKTYYRHYEGEPVLLRKSI
jgi:hypothetical protein